MLSGYINEDFIAKCYIVSFTAADSGDVDMELHQGVNDGNMIESHSSESSEDVLEQSKDTEELQDVPEDVKDMWKPRKATKDVLEPAKNMLEQAEPMLEPLQGLPKICENHQSQLRMCQNQTHPQYYVEAAKDVLEQPASGSEQL